MSGFLSKISKTFLPGFLLFAGLAILAASCRHPSSGAPEAVREIQVGSGTLRVAFERDDIVRIRYTQNSSFSKEKSMMRVPLKPAEFSCKTEEFDDAVVMKTPKLTVRIDKGNGCISYFDTAGNLLLTEKPAAPRELSAKVIEKKMADPDSVTYIDTIDGQRAVASKYTVQKLRDGWTGQVNFQWADGEALYGLGRHEELHGSLRGKSQYLYQHNLKMISPVLVSTKGYGLLFDHYCAMEFHDNEKGSCMKFDVLDDLDYYFVLGPEFDQVVSGIRELTGKAVMMPKWAFGYVQSKERYKNQDELVATAREYRERGIPLDVIVQDWMYWPKGWGEKHYDAKRYPDPAKMYKDLHDMNLKLMISIWPMANGGKNGEEVREKGMNLVGSGTFDAFRREARDLYWKQTYEGLFQYGIDAWWADCTEPETADWNFEKKPSPAEGARVNGEKLAGTVGPLRMNGYALMHSKGIYEGQRGTTEAKRVLNLTRSYYPGQQRYGTISWNGDTQANWDAMASDILSGLHFTVTGGPYWTYDIGAFFVKPKPKFWRQARANYPEGNEDLGYRELYTRWFQAGAFAPLFRSHGTDTAREVWRFGEPGTMFYDTLIKFINLRYRLLPYTYSMAGWVTQDDYTFYRHLAFDFRADPAVYNITDQYMFGPAFMVCPVLKPMYYDVGSKELQGIEKTREVYLPKCAGWYDFWTGRRIKGGQTIQADAPMDRLPLFVRAGSIVPMGPTMQFSSEIKNPPLTLHIYPGTDAEFKLYEDEGDSYNYEKGAFSTIRFAWDDAAEQLEVGSRKGAYPDMPAVRTFKLVLHGGTGPHEKTVEYDGSPKVLRYSGE